MMATSQAISAGKFQAGDLNQIMNNGLPVWTLLAKGMHKTVPELRDLSSHGKLLASDVLPVLQEQMHKDYGGAMAKQSQTLSGQWSTMQDTFSQGMAKVLEPMVPLIKDALPGAMSIMGKAMEGGGKGLEKLIGWVKGGKDGFTDLRSAVIDCNGHLIDDSTNLEIVGGIFQIVGGKVKDFTQSGIAALVKWFRDELLPALSKASDVIMPKVKDAFNSVSDTMKKHQDIIKAVQAAFTIVGKFITDLLIPALAWLAGVIVDQVGPQFKAWAAVMSNVVIPAIKFLLQVFIAVVGGILNAAAKAFGWVPGVGPKLKSAASAFDQFARDANNALNRITDKTVKVSIVHVEAGTYTNFGTGHALAMASGGIVTRPTFALVGEAGPEAVVPLSGRGGLGGDINVTINGFMGNEDAIQRQVTDAVRRATNRGYGTAFA
jgi:tape measure domain-containing protein